MKNHLPQIGLLIIVIILFSSCTSMNHFYNVPIHPTPFFEKSGNLYFEGNTSFHHRSFYAGAAVTNFLGAYYGMNRSGHDVQSIIKMETTYANYTHSKTCGIGLYLNKFISQKNRLEIFAEHTRYNYTVWKNNPYDISNGHPHGIYNNLFGTYAKSAILINYGLSYKAVRIGATFKAGQVKFGSFDTSDSIVMRNELKRLKYRNDYMVYEASGFIMLGLRTIKLKVQPQIGLCPKGNESVNAIPHIQYSINIGVVLSPDLLWVRNPFYL